MPAGAAQQPWVHHMKRMGFTQCGRWKCTFTAMIFILTGIDLGPGLEVSKNIFEGNVLLEYSGNIFLGLCASNYCLTPLSVWQERGYRAHRHYFNPPDPNWCSTVRAAAAALLAAPLASCHQMPLSSFVLPPDFQFRHRESWHPAPPMRH